MEPTDEPSGWTGHLSDFWARHRTLFWTVHSVWALATGIAVILLARERYAFVPWVVVFLGITWLSTIVFGRRVRSAAEGEESDEESDEEGDEESDEEGRKSIGLGEEVASYATRTLFQETLFFLIPFYAYSTVLRSSNVLFTLLLAALAVFSCIDLVFDRWLRTRPGFGFIFFATVAFAATNLLLPMVFGVPPRVATPLAAVLAIATSIPLVVHGAPISLTKMRAPLLASAGLLVVTLLLPRVIPPVPLRMQSATFASNIERETLIPVDTLGASVGSEELAGYLVLLVEVFAPSNVPTEATLTWRRDGAVVHTSRSVDILAHESAFRVWDALRVDGGQIPAGDYVVTLDASGRVFGMAKIAVQ